MNDTEPKNHLITGNPADYVEIEDFSDLTGHEPLRSKFPENRFPPEAYDALIGYLHHSVNTPETDDAERHAAIFTGIMGFTPQELKDKAEELQKKANKK